MMKRVIPIFTVLMGIYWIYESAGLKLWVRKGPGDGFIPLLAGILLVGLGAFILLRDFAASRLAAQTDGTQSAEEKKEARNSFIHGMLPAAGLVGVVLLTNLIGLILSLLVFVFCWLFLYEKYSLLKSLLISSITMVALYLIFGIWLKSMLPTGMLGLI